MNNFFLIILAFCEILVSLAQISTSNSMSLNSLSLVSAKTVLEKALGRFVEDGNNTVITDIYLQPKQGSGELVLLNDDDDVLASAVIEEWVGLEDDFYPVVERVLRDVLNELQNVGSFDRLCLLKPYSFVLVDAEKETIADLLLVDDQETLLLHDGMLLEGLDDELDTFLKELLED